MEAINSIAYDSIIKYYNLNYGFLKCEALDNWFLTTMEESLPNACKGHATEYYIIKYLINNPKGKKFRFQVHAQGKPDEMWLEIENFDVVYFK
jgi:hypothetical protein